MQVKIVSIGLIHKGGGGGDKLSKIYLYKTRQVQEPITKTKI